MIMSHFDMQEKDIIEYTNRKSRVFTSQNAIQEDTLEHTNAMCLVCVHFSQLVDHCVTQ